MSEYTYSFFAIIDFGDKIKIYSSLEPVNEDEQKNIVYSDNINLDKKSITNFDIPYYKALISIFAHKFAEHLKYPPNATTVSLIKKYDNELANKCKQYYMKIKE